MTAPGTPKAKRGSGPAKLEPAEIAEILEYGRLQNDTKAAEKYGISVRTVRRWRAAIRDGKLPEVAAVVTAQRQEVARRSADLICDTLDKGLLVLQERFASGKMSDKDLIDAVEKVGQLRVTRDALNGAGVGAPHGEPTRTDQQGSGASSGARPDPDGEVRAAGSAGAAGTGTGEPGDPAPSVH